MITPFPEYVEKVVRAKVASMKKEGTAAVGADCLWQSVAQDLSQHPQSPRGTNGAYFARQAFNQVIGQIGVRAFIL
jgi:hypothetical protein